MSAIAGEGTANDPGRIVDEYETLVAAIDHLCDLRLAARFTTRQQQRYSELCRLERLARPTYVAARTVLEHQHVRSIRNHPSARPQLTLASTRAAVATDRVAGEPTIDLTDDGGGGVAREAQPAQLRQQLRTLG